MRHKVLRRLITASMVTLTFTALAPIGASAAWIQNGYGTWSYTEGYSYATGWRQINGAWYFFDSYGQMKTGWIPDNGEWYYADLNGVMQRGVIQIEGKVYFFSDSGAMQRGQIIVNTKLCNFGDNGVYIGNDYPAPSKAFDHVGNPTLPYVPSQIVNENATMLGDIPSDGKVHAKQYKVTFKDPDAEDDEDEILKTRTVEEKKYMPLYTPTKSGYTFVEWNTESDGDGTSYDITDKIRIKENITLYAQWKKNADTSN